MKIFTALTRWAPLDIHRPCILSLKHKMFMFQPGLEEDLTKLYSNFWYEDIKIYVSWYANKYSNQKINFLQSLISKTMMLICPTCSHNSSNHNGKLYKKTIKTNSKWLTKASIQHRFIMCSLGWGENEFFSKKSHKNDYPSFHLAAVFSRKMLNSFNFSQKRMKFN